MGLVMLTEASTSKLETLPGFGVELRYQDGFIFEDNDTPEKFLRDKMALEFQVPKQFLINKNIDNDIKMNNISFNVDINRPKGLFINKLSLAKINGEPGFVMETIVRSADENIPRFSVGSLEKWLDEAHDIQHHSFKTLIEQKFARTFE